MAEATDDFILPLGDGIYDGEMPSPADQDFLLTLHVLRRDLRGVVINDLPAFSLSHALDTIGRKAATRDYRPNRQQADELRFAIREALHAGELNLPP
jgi:hypothetical protein